MTQMKRMFVIAVEGQGKKGYIRAVNYTKETGSVTTKKNNAKRYSSFDEATADVDTLIVWAQSNGLFLTIL